MHLWDGGIGCLRVWMDNVLGKHFNCAAKMRKHTHCQIGVRPCQT